MDFKEINKIPSSPEAERALLGGLFYNLEIFDEIIEIIRAEDFYLREHSAIFNAMLSLFSQGKTLDPILVSNEISLIDKINAENTRKVLEDIIGSVSSSYNLVEHAQLIKEKSLLRKLGSAGSKITEIAYKDDREVGDIVDEAEALILSLTNKVNKKEIISIKDASTQEFKRLEYMLSNRGKTLGISTNLIDLDRMTGGLNNSDLIILAARPGMGKTALALNIVLNVAKNENKSVLFFSLEMSVSQLYQRLIAIESGIPLSNIRNAFLDDEAWTKLGLSITKLTNTKISIADTSNISALEIRSYARKEKSKGSLDLIVIDYLQLIKGSGKPGDNRQQEISEISRSLKTLARELDVPIIALSQLSRNTEQRTDKRPMLSDLRESGAIEQDADIVAFLYRDEYYNPESQDKGIAELIIGKQRNGPTGIVRLNFISETTIFRSYTDQVK